jgi:predicted protein tyrosine phosphatase
MNTLIVCDFNIHRGPAVESYLKKIGYCKPDELLTVGLYLGFPNKFNRKNLDWANELIVMEYIQEHDIRLNYDTNKKIYVLDIPKDPRLLFNSNLEKIVEKSLNRVFLYHG